MAYPEDTPSWSTSALPLCQNWVGVLWAQHGSVCLEIDKCSSPENNNGAEKTAPARHGKSCQDFSTTVVVDLHSAHGCRQEHTNTTWLAANNYSSLGSRRKQLKSTYHFIMASTLTRNAATKSLSLLLHTEEDCTVTSRRLSAVSLLYSPATCLRRLTPTNSLPNATGTQQRAPLSLHILSFSYALPLYLSLSWCLCSPASARATHKVAL